MTFIKKNGIGKKHLDIYIYIIDMFFSLVNPSNSITQVSNVRRNASLVELGIVGDELPMPKVPSLKLFQGSTYQN